MITQQSQTYQFNTKVIQHYMKESLNKHTSRSKQNKVLGPIPTARITIRVDQLIKNTYSGIMNGKIKNLIEKDVTPSNQLLIQYIHQIYKQYDIQEPFEKYSRLSSLKVNLNQSHNTQFYPTQKLSYSRQTYGEQSCNVSRIPKVLARSKQKIIKLKQKGVQISQLQNSFTSRINRDSQDSRQTSSSIKRKIMYSTPQNIKPSLKDSMNVQYFDSNRNKNQSQKQQDSISSTRITDNYIKPIFRYCIGCQQSILQANIKSHETKCQQLSDVYNMNVEGILRMLLRKINKFKKQILKIVNNENQNCHKVKHQVKTWLNSFDQVIEGRPPSSFQKQYENIRNAFYCQSVILMELTHKLNWFLKIREQLRIKFNI